MTAEFSARTRAANLARMAAESLDVLVVGGGIVGAWVALAAAKHGYRTGLVDKGDFAGGTSGKTSRLIHGGLRYLQRFRIRLVRQAARERDLLLRLAPDLVKPLTFLIPVYEDRGPKGWQLRIGLWLYDAFSREKALPRRRWVSRTEALALEPRLGPQGLVRAALYSDAMAHDARLVLAVIRAAAEAGALVANYARVVEVVRHDGRVRGVRLVDGETREDLALEAKVVVNATGVWTEDLQEPAHRVKLRPTKGIHVFVPNERIGHRHAVVLPTPDGRAVFALPWGRLSLIGTTDTDYRDDKERVEADREDVEYLLAVVNAAFPKARLTPTDVVSTYAGLRPLLDAGKPMRESDISRGHEIFEDPDGLLTVTGGKLTTARAMADDVVTRIEGRLGARGRADTQTLRIGGSQPPDPEEDLRGAVTHIARYEMAVRLEDVMVRRTRLFYERQDQGMVLAPSVAGMLAAELRWDLTRQAAELARFRSLVEASRQWRGAAGHG